MAREAAPSCRWRGGGSVHRGDGAGSPLTASDAVCNVYVAAGVAYRQVASIVCCRLEARATLPDFQVAVIEPSEFIEHATGSGRAPGPS